MRSTDTSRPSTLQPGCRHEPHSDRATLRPPWRFHPIQRHDQVFQACSPARCRPLPDAAGLACSKAACVRCATSLRPARQCPAPRRRRRAGPQGPGDGGGGAGCRSARGGGGGGAPAASGGRAGLHAAHGRIRQPACGSGGGSAHPPVCTVAFHWQLGGAWQPVADATAGGGASAGPSARLAGPQQVSSFMAAACMAAEVMPGQHAALLAAGAAIPAMLVPQLCPAPPAPGMRAVRRRCARAPRRLRACCVPRRRWGSRRSAWRSSRARHARAGAGPARPARAGMACLAPAQLLLASLACIMHQLTVPPTPHCRSWIRCRCGAACRAATCACRCSSCRRRQGSSRRRWWRWCSGWRRWREMSGTQARALCALPAANPATPARLSPGLA